MPEPAVILLKMAPAKLLDAIKELHGGGAPMSSQIARKVVSAFQTKPVLSISKISNSLLDKSSARSPETAIGLF